MRIPHLLIASMFFLCSILACNSDKRKESQETQDQTEKDFSDTESAHSASGSDNQRQMDLANDQLDEEVLEVDAERLIAFIKSISAEPTQSQQEELHRLAMEGNKNAITKYLRDDLAMNPTQIQIVSAYALNKSIPKRNLVGPDSGDPPTETIYKHEWADVYYRYGDIDNLGFGFPAGFDPFSGESTNRHTYPFYPGPNDPPGTDRIMVISAYDYNSGGQKEGYTTKTRRPHNLPQTLELRYDLKNTKVNSAMLMMFLDDFQAPVFNVNYQVTFNEERIRYAEDIVNSLRQGGPIGKMVAINILPENLDLIRSGKLDIHIDDEVTNKGEGFAIDFVVLLINPKNINTGKIEGKVLAKKGSKPLQGAQVTASGGAEVKTDSEGRFVLESVPYGLAVLSASKAGYETGMESTDHTAAKTPNVIIKLEEKKEDDKSLEKQLTEKGKVELYGIYFDTDKSDIKEESEEVLNAVLTLVNNHPELKLEISGHTDATGNAAHNRKLSGERAKAVVDWLKKNGSSTTNLSSKGYGASQPIANNNTEEGRQRNRRVEIRVVGYN
ncbi:MAG: OmpA family protein [Cyclobacteriaceae bacterium]